MAHTHASDAKHLVDSLKERMARLTRHEPVNLVMDLDPARVAWLDRELPGLIEYFQKLQTEARHQQRARNRGAPGRS